MRIFIAGWRSQASGIYLEEKRYEETLSARYDNRIALRKRLRAEPM